LKRGEKFSGELYDDATGNATIGYGHKVHTGIINGSESDEFKAGITDAQASLLLYADLAPAASDVNRLVSVPMRQNQFDAFVMFRFNVGSKGFSSSSALSEFNKGNVMGSAMSMYLCSKGTVDGQKTFIRGLVNRRAAEYRIFINGEY
jgi:type VI secretion system secreted protein VgrG